MSMRRCVRFCMIGSVRNRQCVYSLVHLCRQEPTRLEALRWISVLLGRSRQEVLDQTDRLLPAVLHALADSSNAVVMEALQVQAQLAQDEPRFRKLMAAVVNKFRDVQGGRGRQG